MCLRTNRSGCFKRSKGLTSEVSVSVLAGKLLSVGEASLTNMRAKYGGPEAKQERFAEGREPGPSSLADGLNAAEKFRDAVRVIQIRIKRLRFTRSATSGN